MGDYTLANYRTAVLDTLDNLSSDHRIVTNDWHTKAINDAANDLIRWFPDLFPEHNDNSWEIGPTIITRNSISLGENCLVVTRVTSADDDSASPALTNWVNVEERLVAQSTVHVIGLLNKDTTDDDFPRLWARYGDEIMYHPTTRTGAETYLRVYGLAGETRISASGGTFRMHRDFDGVIVKLAASKVALMIGQAARSMELEAATEREIKRKFNHVAAGMGILCMEPAFSFTREGGYD